MPKPSAANNEKDPKKKVGGIRAALFGLGALAATSAAEASELPVKNTTDMTATERVMSKAFSGLTKIKIQPLEQVQAPKDVSSPEMPKVEITSGAYELHTLAPEPELVPALLEKEYRREPASVQPRELNMVEPVQLQKPREVEAATLKPIDVTPAPLKDQ